MTPTTPPARSHGHAAGRPQWGLGDVLAGIGASLFLSTFVGAIVFAVAGWESTDDVPVWGLALLQVPLWTGYLVVLVLASRTKGHGIVEDFGARQRWLDVPVGLLIGVVTQVLLLPLLYLPIFQLTGTDSEELSEPAERLASGAGDATAGWLLFALLVGVCAPVVEELFYRGLLLRSLTKRGLGDVAAVLGSSVVFALIHLQLLQFPGLLVFGLVAGVLTVRTGRLGPAIWAHIGFNMATVVLLYLGR